MPTDKRDVREEMREAAAECENVAMITHPMINTDHMRLASRVLKHNAGAELVGLKCSNGDGCSYGPIPFSGTGMFNADLLTNEIRDDHEKRCGGTLVELIERYRGDDA